MLSLIELSQAEAELLEELEYESPEGLRLSEAEQAEIIDRYLNASEAFKEKLDRYALVIKAKKKLAEFRLEEAKRLKALAENAERIADLLEERLIYCLSQRKEIKIETSRFKLSVVNNGGKPPLEIPKEWEEEPAKAPEQFHRHKIELDKETLRRALEEGQEIKDCKIGERGRHLRIK